MDFLFDKQNSKTEEQKDQPRKESPENEQRSSADREWGYDLYPERKGAVSHSISSIVFGGKGTESVDKIKCERNVYKCVKQSKLVQLMMSALKSSGCAIDIRRHISCEECSYNVSGGYDPLLNQIVVCQNVATSENIVQGVLTHEMVHMFDYCRNELDFKNLDHLACTEIRAANLAHCSFTSALIQGHASIFNIKEAHQNCVKSKALESILAVRKVSVEEAVDAIERVFTRCYNDLEPIGRRIRRNSDDIDKAYTEAFYFGYDTDPI